MITDYDQIRKIGGFKDAGDDIFEPFSDIAASRLKKIAGTDIYEDAGSETPGNVERSKDLKVVEAYLVLFYAVQKLNMVYIQGGGISHSGSVGDERFKFLSPKEVKETKEIYLNEIDTLLSRWVACDVSKAIQKSEAVEEE